jgi:hypothetical protein
MQGIWNLTSTMPYFSLRLRPASIERPEEAMDEKLKKRWIEALRSGRYKKGKGFLKTVSKSGRTTHCCLGVLCDITKTKHGTEDGYLPHDLADSTKLYDYKQTELIERNDGGSEFKRAWSFNRIADYIERNL